MEKLLIVDDEESMRRLLRLHLEDRYEIVDTGDPRQALALALKDRPDAILLDLRMPKYSGFELCRTFSSVTATQLIPLIIVSGDTAPTARSLSSVLGAKAFFTKPVDFPALRAGLEELIAAARPERRSEMRLNLRVMLKLRGTDVSGQPFEEVSATVNLSPKGFLCGCTRPLAIDSSIEVSLAAERPEVVGTARIVRAEDCETAYPRYGVRFLRKQRNWILG